jgi:hypothetical protein
VRDSGTYRLKGATRSMAIDNSQLIELPDREVITLCEAITAFVYGKACDSTEWNRDRLKQPADLRGLERRNTLKGRKGTQGTTELVKTSSRSAEDLLERLRSAAYAGRVKFRAIQEGGDPADGYKDIDPLYFSIKPLFHWSQDVIVCLENESSKPWYFVHLDRDDFVSFLKDMGVSVQHSPGADAQHERKTFETGVAGRPTSIHLVLPLARSRLNAGDYPATLQMFSEQLAEALATNEPRAHRMTPKAIRNNPEFTKLWRRKSPK